MRRTQPNPNNTIELVYDPHPGQVELHLDPHRFRIAVCGRRFGKTTFAINELILNALLFPGTTNWYIAPTYRQAKQIAWELIKKYLPFQEIASRKELELTLRLRNDSTIQLKGTDNPDSLRGVGIHLAVLDEYAQMKPFVWEEIIRPTLIDTGGKAIFIGTPKGFDHFYQLYLTGQKGSEIYDSDYQSFKKTTYDNPLLPKEEIDKAKDESTEDAFAQEYLADFRTFTGRVYKDFDRDVHVIPPFQTPETWTYGRYLDRGWRVPSGVGFLAIDDETDTWYVIDEIYETNLTNPQLSEMVKGKEGNRYFWHSYGDSAAASDLSDLEELGCYFAPVKKEPGEKAGDWIRAGVERISERLKIQPGTGKPRIYVFSNCKNHISEFENYVWDDKKGEDHLTEKPKKKNDHLMDGIRYFAMMYKRDNGEEYGPTESKHRDWSFR